MLRDNIEKIFTLFFRSLLFNSFGFWVGTYLFPQNQIRGNVILALIAGSILAVLISIVYRPASVSDIETGFGWNEVDFTKILIGMGYYPSTEGREYTVFSLPGSLALASKILVHRKDKYSEIYGPYIEIKRFRRRVISSLGNKFTDNIG